MSALKMLGCVKYLEYKRCTLFGTVQSNKFKRIGLWNIKYLFITFVRIIDDIGAGCLLEIVLGYLSYL